MSPIEIKNLLFGVKLKALHFNAYLSKSTEVFTSEYTYGTKSILGIYEVLIMQKGPYQNTILN